MKKEWTVQRERIIFFSNIVQEVLENGVVIWDRYENKGNLLFIIIKLMLEQFLFH